MLSLSSDNVEGENRYTWDFKLPCSQKATGVKSSNRGGYMILLPLLITRFQSKVSKRNNFTQFAARYGAPSCIKVTADNTPLACNTARLVRTKEWATVHQLLCTFSNEILGNALQKRNNRQGKRRWNYTKLPHGKDAVLSPYTHEDSMSRKSKCYAYWRSLGVQSGLHASTTH